MQKRLKTINFQSNTALLNKLSNRVKDIRK